MYNFFMYDHEGYTHLAAEMPDGNLVEIRRKCHRGSMGWCAISEPEVYTRVPTDIEQLYSSGLDTYLCEFIIQCNPEVYTDQRVHVVQNA